MNQKGFTLIELLIVVVIIGILAAIAIPRFGDTRERAYVSAMQSDIGQARTAMEMCYQDAENPAFSYENCGLDEIGIDATGGDTGYTAGVTLAITGATADDYLISADHDATDRSCSYQHSSGASAGQIVCVEGT